MRGSSFVLFCSQNASFFFFSLFSLFVCLLWRGTRCIKDSQYDETMRVFSCKKKKNLRNESNFYPQHLL